MQNLLSHQTQAATERFFLIIHDNIVSYTLDYEIHEELGAVGDLNGDGKDEVALVWLTMGPTYWRNTLTVFTPVASGEYTTENDSTFSLIGEAKAPQIKDGVILIEQVVHAENDPICCPTVQKPGKYKWENKKLAEVK